MDEPSSAIDAETEYEILESLKDIANGRTAIIVSHRLSCAKYADKIIHINDGRIVEIGSHDYLMKANGEYAKLFRLQSEHYQEVN